MSIEEQNTYFTDWKVNTQTNNKKIINSFYDNKEGDPTSPLWRRLPWDFFGRNDAKAETPVPRDEK